jgi:hypothetical protein
MSCHFIFLLALLAGFTTNCSVRQSQNHNLCPADSINSSGRTALIMLLDSTMAPYDSISWKKPLEYVAFPHSEDTLFTDTFRLKNNYRLILFPVADYYSGDGKIHYGHYARLVGNGIDSVITSSYYDAEPLKYRLRYTGIDFDDSFAIEQGGGGNYSLYIELFEKKTGRQIISGYSGTYDVENGLILYLDDVDIFLYDVKNNKKIKVETPDNPCFEESGSWTCYTITKVTPSVVYLRYDCCDKPVTIKVKLI